MKHNLKLLLKRSRGFIFSVFAIFVIWMVSAMSETNRYRESFELCFDGIDTAKYAIMECDSVIEIDITSNGFQAFKRDRKKKSIHLDASPIVLSEKKIRQHKVNNGYEIVFNTEECLDSIRKQIDLRGVTEISPVNKQLKIRFAEREKRTFRPDISNVEFQFDGLAGLNGEPRVVPDSIVLYGSKASLDKIGSIHAQRQIVKDIYKSGTYQVSLEPVWEKFSDLRISTKKIKVYLPVERFIEKDVTLPVNVDKKDIGISSSMKLNLYPTHVTVTYLVPENEYSTINTDAFVVKAIKESDSSYYLRAIVSSFPSKAKVKDINPKKIQFIAIE